MSRELIQRMIGAYVDASAPASALASIVEYQLQTGKFSRAVTSYLRKLPECPELRTVHVSALTETSAICTCHARVRDHESPRYFTVESAFEVNLTTGLCQEIA